MIYKSLKINYGYLLYVELKFMTPLKTWVQSHLVFWVTALASVFYSGGIRSLPAFHHRPHKMHEPVMLVSLVFP